MHKQRLFILVAAALGLVGLFLPWISITFFGVTISANGLTPEIWGGYVFLGMTVATAVMALTQGDRAQEMGPDAKKKVAGIAGAAVGFMIYFIFVKLTLGAAGIGAWLALVSALGMLAVPFIIKGDGSFEMPNKDTVQADLNSDNPDAEGSEE